MSIVDMMDTIFPGVEHPKVLIEYIGTARNKKYPHSVLSNHMIELSEYAGIPLVFDKHIAGVYPNIFIKPGWFDNIEEVMAEARKRYLQECG